MQRNVCIVRLRAGAPCRETCVLYVYVQLLRAEKRVYCTFTCRCFVQTNVCIVRLRAGASCRETCIVRLRAGASCRETCVLYVYVQVLYVNVRRKKTLEVSQ